MLVIIFFFNLGEKGDQGELGPEGPKGNFNLINYLVTNYNIYF